MDIELVQQFASLNRQAILDEIAKGMKWKISDQFESQHNYVDLSGDGLILREGRSIRESRGDGHYPCQYA